MREKKSIEMISKLLVLVLIVNLGKVNFHWVTSSPSGSLAMLRPYSQNLNIRIDLLIGRIYIEVIREVTQHR